MPKINQLSFEVANLIAAGEVVERPASVVKELLENAIDAGATAVTAEIARGGVSLIRVADNGIGMEAEDLPVAIRRHATSKIASAEDLGNIASLGFRGEALAAIAAVSRLSIITKTASAASGTMLVSESGTVKEISEVGCADGTTVTVEELFSNVPARRKFLKKDVTETQAVSAVVEKIAMSRPDIAFRFIADGVTKFSTAGDGDVSHTLYALYGRDFATRLLSLDGALGDITVSGYVGRPDNARANRNHQNVFINGRYVKSKTVSAAIERAFTSYMAPERFPVAVVYLTVPGFAVDVNVHPAKLEVKFTDERAVFEAVYYAIRSALEGSVARPELAFDRKPTGAERQRASAHSFERPAHAEQIKMPPPVRPQEPVGGESQTKPKTEPKAEPVTDTLRPPVRDAFEPTPVSVRANDLHKQEATLSPARSIEICERFAEARAAEAPAVPEGKASADAVSEPIATADARGESAPSYAGAKVTAPPPKEELPSYRILGVAFRCYILVELEDERMLVIDQHAAHERILFEELKRSRQSSASLSVPLLLPLTVFPSEEELGVAETEREALEALGFSYRIADKKILLLAIPGESTPADAGDLFLHLCEDALGGADPAVSEEMRRERMLYRIACKAAIKGGRHYDDVHVEWLVKEVLSLPDVTVCPHGRPIAFYLTKKELDRQFDRIK